MPEKTDPKFIAWLKEMAEQFLGHKAQAISMPNIYSLVYTQLDSMNRDETSEGYTGLVDVYLDGPNVFAVLSKGGLLYRCDVSLTDGGAVLGGLTQVEVDYKPVSQRVRTVQQADGKYRWFAFPAATAVLNKSGELDTRQLFQSFVDKIENGLAPYPYLTFYHVGKQIVFGQADYAAVDGYTYLLSGTWEDTPLATAMRKAIESNPEYYGISIGFYYDPQTTEKLEVENGVSVPMYTDGINSEASILAEIDAACLYTGAYTEGVNRMNKKAKDELLKVAGDDPTLQAEVEVLAAKVDEVNKDIVDKDLIRRSTETVPVEKPEQTEVPPAEPEEEPQELLMTEEAMKTLADQVIAGVTANFTAQLASVYDKMDTMSKATDVIIQGLQERIKHLEAPLEEAVAQAVEDLPRKNKIFVGYRPRTVATPAAQPEDEEPTSEEIAQETLATLKSGKEK